MEKKKGDAYIEDSDKGKRRGGMGPAHKREGKISGNQEGENSRAQGGKGTFPAPMLK